MSSPAAKLTILESVDSTNNYAMAMIQKGAAISGSAVFAMEQRMGKGRRGKSWKSEAGANVLLTIVTQMQWLPVQEQFYLSMAIAVACVDFFSKYTKENIKIKWPNDIFINDRKAGGILIENVIQGNLWQWAVSGIGLNINEENFEKNGLKAVSLKEVTGKHFDVILLAKELHEIVLNRLLALESGERDLILGAYNQNLFRKNELVRLKKGPVVFESTIERVSASGELITKDVTERSFRFDEVRWLL